MWAVHLQHLLYIPRIPSHYVFKKEPSDCFICGTHLSWLVPVLEECTVHTVHVVPVQYSTPIYVLREYSVHIDAQILTVECVNADMSMNTYECFYEWQAFPMNAYTLRRSPLNQNAIYSWMLNYQRNAMLKLCNPGANLSWMPKYLNFNSIYIRSYQVFITVNTYKYLVMLGLWVNLIKKKLTIL